jgi:hypothetical protein
VQAVTCDDFLAAMADGNGVDLSQMQRWYQQAGTPELTVTPAVREPAPAPGCGWGWVHSSLYAWGRWETMRSTQSS